MIDGVPSTPEIERINLFNPDDDFGNYEDMDFDENWN